MLLLLLISSAFLLPWAGAGRIIGGQEAEAHSRPYMAFLKIKASNKTSRCGGFLIRPDAVLSAAHCVDKEGIVNITVILGAHNIRVQEQSQQRIPAARWVIHPKYSPVGCINDIVLLKLKTKAKINEFVQLISIPMRNERVAAGTKCRVAGWGRTSWTGRGSDVMMEVQLKVQNDEPCKQLFRNYKRLSMMCVGDQNSEKSTYKGDSGGPLVCNQKAYGIVSRGYRGKLFPEVFTRVSYFEPWIDEQLRKFALQELPGSPSSE
ncbi:cathepsin G-like isoform X3 [Oenanthe melanoleuca]|uniref:cathepsin G-like isoform X2 n=1 Tax=Oenanthe melanoleuca TaxID=2939378 RepID=UPI0024C20138|nr:cathepsin G-like isoform X2 [Oenanthe melanoleuca]XP_056368160.1 cathepsin G-like isoform X3 [Oenanthe melanoleuca]